MNEDLKKLAQLHDENIELKKEIEESYINGFLTGLKICKEMWAQGTISHENIYENEVYYKEQLKDLNANVKKLKTEREWISVNDRLPEKNGDYLCYLIHDNPKCDNRITTIIWVNMWSNVIGDNWVESYSVTHWMPLPEPPKQ